MSVASDYSYQCTANTGCKAAVLSKGRSYEGNCADYEAHDKPLGNDKARPKLLKTVITGLILSIVYAIGLIIYGQVRGNLKMGIPVILTFLTGIPIGAVAYTLLRLLKNTINKGATGIGQSFKMGGNLFGWLLTTVLIYGSPIIVFFIMSGVFGATLF